MLQEVDVALALVCLYSPKVWVTTAQWHKLAALQRQSLPALRALDWYRGLDTGWQVKGRQVSYLCEVGPVQAVGAPSKRDPESALVIAIWGSKHALPYLLMKEINGILMSMVTFSIFKYRQLVWRTDISIRLPIYHLQDGPFGEIQLCALASQHYRNPL